MAAPVDRIRVLIVAGDPMVAALLGMLLDPSRHEPVFPQLEERPEDALARLRPPLAILLDGELETARSDLFQARAQRARAALVLFTTPSAGRAYDAPSTTSRFALPVDRAALTRILDEALGGGVRITLGLGTLMCAAAALSAAPLLA